MKKKDIKRIEKNNTIISMYRVHRSYVGKKSYFSTCFNRIEAKEIIKRRLGLSTKDLTLISTKELKKMLSSVL